MARATGRPPSLADLRDLGQTPPRRPLDKDGTCNTTDQNRRGFKTIVVTTLQISFMRSTSTTWLGQLLAAIALIGGSLEVAWIFRTGWLSVVVAGLMAALGLAILIRAESRERPLRLLRKARRTLDLPDDWGVEFNKPLPYGGTLPIVATRTDAARFLIGVSGCREVNAAREVIGHGAGLLVDVNGKHLNPDPIPALAKAATAFAGTAVLWLPDARVTRNLRLLASNLIVVMGTARHLKHALVGAEVVVARHEQPQVLVERRKKPRTPHPALSATDAALKRALH